jgi:hypothetical protein
MLNGPYVMINQLIKSIWKVAHGYIHEIRNQGCTFSKDFDDYLF